MSARKPRDIELGSPMIQAWREGCSGYVPAHDGLAVEYGHDQTSFDNLMLLLEDDRREVCAMHSGPGGILVVFSTGETFLATGFRFRNEKEDEKLARRGHHPLRLLAKFCAQVWGADARAWFDHLNSPAFGECFEGPIPRGTPRGYNLSVARPE